MIAERNPFHGDKGNVLIQTKELLALYPERFCVSFCINRDNSYVIARTILFFPKDEGRKDMELVVATLYCPNNRIEESIILAAAHSQSPQDWQYELRVTTAPQIGDELNTLKKALDETDELAQLKTALEKDYCVDPDSGLTTRISDSYPRSRIPAGEVVDYLANAELELPPDSKLTLKNILNGRNIQ